MAKEPKFEEALDRLEDIVEKMNAGKTSLDESLKLFEEADKLIVSCHKRLNEAEKKIEVLIKNRSGDLEFDAEGNPLVKSIKDQ